MNRDVEQQVWQRVLGQPVGGKFLYFLPAGREVPL